MVCRCAETATAGTGGESEDSKCKGLKRNIFFFPVDRKHKTDEELGASHPAPPAAGLSDNNSEPGKKISRQHS